ncbi:zinc finger protein 260-like [Plodia interpunctella]|uniref:zinc finger protein 260-like n=1 Tax=Plodia interpunctella TaxID=58824 RepID=UPI0023679259|nr:zinc finger protein 260-like [Plodia interpunctella]XP_053623448.1 zinc finger protein 260-like [Plodia interpunctella]
MSVKKGKGPVFDPGLCRCCGAMKKCRVLNVAYEYMGEALVYSDLLMDCFGLLVSHLDGKPSERLICATCVMRLRDACSFRKQVLQCEEAFLQMKMLDGDREDQKHAINHMQMEEAIVEGAPKIELQLKVEADGSGGSGCEDAGTDYDQQNETADVKPENIDDMSNDDIPLNQLMRGPGAPSPGPAGPDLGTNGVTQSQIVQKPKLPMSKVQQLIRERDPSYMTETNILTILEFSYVCPFKCRHNHLLCYYCGQNFTDPQHMREHTETYHHPRKFKITEHKNMIKIDLTRIDCRLCTQIITTLEEFKIHITSMHGKHYYFNYKDSVLPFRLTKDLKCALCEVNFPYFHALNKHMNEHFSNYVCETCGLGFVDKGRFVMHQQRHDEGDFPCESCGKVFKAQYNRDLHIDRVHKKKGRVYCPKCDIKLMSYPQKLKHLVEVHGEAPLSFPCNMCDKIFETRRMLTIHRRKDHLKDYRYECQCCGQKFFTRFALNNHMPTHTGERNFKCKVCEKCYPRLKTLKDHMRIHTNDRRYRCHICGQAFIQNCSLKGHMKSQHPEYG